MALAFIISMVAAMLLLDKPRSDCGFAQDSFLWSIFFVGFFFGSSFGIVDMVPYLCRRGVLCTYRVSYMLS